MLHFQTYLRVALLGMLLALLLVDNISPISAPASAASKGCAWQMVSSPSPGLYGNTLSGVAAISHSDAWAVGSSAIQSTTQPFLNNLAMIQHWDGTRWSVIPSPQPANYRNGLSGVAALSSSNVWAVGAYDNAAGGHELPTKTLIEHWNGTRWSTILSPNVRKLSNYLVAITALAPNDIWVVGAHGTTLIEHWDGVRWSIVPSPNPAQGATLDAVTALSSSDVWAVGNYVNGKSGARTLIEHWNGKHWSVVKSPNIGLSDNLLLSVAGVAPDDLWTFGYYVSGNITVSLIEHWDGRRWSIVPHPNPPGNRGDLDSIAALASNDVWALGYYRSNSQGGPLIEHWNGKQWNMVPGPNERYWYVNGVAALNAHDLWAVGSTTGNTLIMRYC